MVDVVGGTVGEVVLEGGVGCRHVQLGITGRDACKGIPDVDGAVGRGGGKCKRIGTAGQGGGVFVGYPYLSSAVRVDAVFVIECGGSVGDYLQRIVCLGSALLYPLIVGCVLAGGKIVEIIVRVSVYIIFKKVVVSHVAPCVRGFAIEQQVVLAVEDAVVVDVNNLYGNALKVVGLCGGVAHGKHFAFRAVQLDARAWHLGEGLYLTCGNLVNTCCRDGNLIPQSRCQPRLSCIFLSR